MKIKALICHASGMGAESQCRYIQRAGKALPEEFVEELLTEIKSGGVTLADIARRTGVCTGTLRRIRNGTYRKVLGPARKDHPQKMSDERAAQIRAQMEAEPGTTLEAFARRFGIDKGMACAIRRGKLNEWRQAHRERQKSNWGETVLFTSRLPQRCKTCGGMVLMPCLLCKVRNGRDEPEKGHSSQCRLSLILDGRTTRKPYR